MHVLIVLNEFRRSLRSAFAVFLISVSACAQGPATPTPASTDAKTALQPYLGTWRPTSYREGLNIGSLTISVDGLSIETGSSLTYEFVKQTEEGVIVRVTGRKPANAFPTVTALAFSVETQVVTAPTGMTWTRDLLRICYWSSTPDRLAELGIKKALCGNTYIR